MFNKIKAFMFNDQSEIHKENVQEVQKSKEKSEIFIIPISGEIINLDDVADEVFSQRMMGDGFAIEPENGVLFSPVDGIITSVFPTKHAITIRSNCGVDILIHFGLDTVNLKGEGFNVYVEQGNSVSAGDKLLEVNIEEIKDKVPSIVVLIVFIELNGKKFSYNLGQVKAKDKNVVIIK
ncbi:PTS sugar transporter subunit IIA [Clostridium psychrophilum]|uniref:PTS sugar transporter subunit IIA n=1 Tax=Clostridium psychrophilum TaxID=132926 RepID=UPI001C0B94A1|nr:PTS glucose transporter subunit IIA [Clostridium psychrophilum]MBU3182338.1 PTS glucose transporter subunit IIA [Clostridium psychrophilum]